jgi:pimeloyl-ACP methyl ester carboxylesterase
MNEPPANPGPDLPPAESGTAIIEAVVQTTDTETVYRRAGKGVQILLLVAGSGSGTLQRTLLHTLAEHFRVFAPRFPPRANGALPAADGTTGAEVSTWLRDLIDGLGLERPSIVADERLGIAALSFALLDPERVDRLVMLCRDAAQPGYPQDALDDTLSRSGRPLLVLHLPPIAEPDLLPASARESLRRFLMPTTELARQGSEKIVDKVAGKAAS